MTEAEATREELAEYAHAAWSGWIDYFFSKCTPGLDGDDAMDGSLIIQPWAVERWRRQAATPYADLPEEEKESDRQEADRMLAIVRGQCLCGCDACKYCENLLEPADKEKP